MKRALLLLAACGGGGSVSDGGNQISYSFRRGGESWYLALDVKLKQPPPAASRGIDVKAACQVGEARLVDVTPPERDAAFKTEPFLILHTLPGKPSRCEITLRDTSFDLPPRIVAQFCIGDPTAPGACPPNKLVPEAGPTGVRADLVSVKGESADSLGFPEHLTVAYRVTAHRDMVRGAYLVRTTTCPGRRADETWHAELGDLSGGESFDAAQNTYKLGRPPPGTPCETRFGYSPRVDGDVTPIATFCHVDETIKPGPC